MRYGRIRMLFYVAGSFWVRRRKNELQGLAGIVRDILLWQHQSSIGRKSASATGPQSAVHNHIRRGENHEGRNPSELLSGNRYLQLWKHIRYRFYKAGDPRRNLF